MCEWKKEITEKKKNQKKKKRKENTNKKHIAWHFEDLSTIF